MSHRRKPTPDTAPPASAPPPGDPAPRSYEAIVREQVPLPDSSYRPQRPEEAAALARPRGPRITAAPDADADAVRAALAGIAHADLADVDVHVSRGRASLDGSVARDQDRVRIVDALQALHLEIDDELRIRDP